MSFFSSVKGPDVRELRLTFQNICATLTQDERYNDGIDADGVSELLSDVYYYVTGNRNQRLRLPAPIADLNDKYRVMWPEGAKISSRAPSAASRNSRVPSLAKSYTQKDVNRASSVISSSIASKHRYIPFASDDEDTEAEQSTKQRRSRMDAKKSSSRHNKEDENPLSFRSRQKQRKNSINTVKINSQPLVHSDSIEAIRAAKNNDIDNSDDEDVPPLAPRPPASRRVYNGPVIADD